MFALLGQMMRLPFAFMGYLFEMASVTTKGLEQIAEQSFREALSPSAEDGSSAGQGTLPPEPVAPAVPLAPPAPPPEEPSEPMKLPDPWRMPEPRTREETQMADTNLNDEMVKLVEFTIVTIERGNERKLVGPEQILVTDDLTGNAFSNARIADWSETAKGKDADVRSNTLRVYYNVLDRWPKEDLKKDERQIEYLKEIADELKRRPAGKSV
jgi:hypothetical protein